jgi:enoyl-[acyl-carrier protein] reductase I
MGLMQGKRGLIMGVANDHSIAWGIASALDREGAELAFTYQGEAFGKRVGPLAEKIGAKIVLPCDVTDDASLAGVFDTLANDWGSLDFVVHAVAYSEKEELKGRYLDTTRGNFTRTLLVSCYSFTAVAKAALPLMGEGGSLLTLSYLGAERVTPNYNVMGVAKAAPFPPGQCAPWPVPPSPMRASSMAGAGTTRRSIARWRLRRWGTRASTSCLLSRAG